MGQVSEKLSKEIGDPPVWFSDDQRTAWGDVISCCPDLQPSDAVFISLCAVALSRYRNCGEAGDVARQALKNILRPMLKDCLISRADAERLFVKD